jgi:hypothetical protein
MDLLPRYGAEVYAEVLPWIDLEHPRFGCGTDSHCGGAGGDSVG